MSTLHLTRITIPDFGSVELTDLSVKRGSLTFEVELLSEDAMTVVKKVAENFDRFQAFWPKKKTLTCKVKLDGVEARKRRGLLAHAGADFLCAVQREAQALVEATSPNARRLIADKHCAPTAKQPYVNDMRRRVRT